MTRLCRVSLTSKNDQELNLIDPQEISLSVRIKGDLIYFEPKITFGPFHEELTIFGYHIDDVESGERILTQIFEEGQFVHISDCVSFLGYHKEFDDE